MSETGGGYVITVNASASFSGTDAPAYDLLVNGSIVATGTIDSSNAESQSFTISAAPTTAEVISIIYLNHTASSQMLNVRSIDINGAAITTGSAGEDYVSSAGTYESWGQMYFGGQINVPVPASYFPAAAGSGSMAPSSPPGSGSGSSATADGSGGATTAPPTMGVAAGQTACSITVNADASFNGNAYPMFDLLVDNQDIGSATVNSNNIQGFSFTANLVAGAAHNVEILYPNHTSSAQLLNVQSIIVNGQTISSSDPAETYISPGGSSQQTGQMYFGGTLDFALPAVDFAAPAATPPGGPMGGGGSSGTGSSSTGGVATGGGQSGATTTGDGTTGQAGSPSAGPAVFVSSSGNDANNGSQAHPFATLGAAIKAMERAGIHTTYLESGTYAVSSTIQLGTGDDGDNILAAAGAVPVLQAVSGASTLLDLSAATGVTLTGLTFDDAATSAQNAALTLSGASGNTISGDFFNNNGEAALFAAGSSNNVFTDNEINGSATSSVEVKDGSNNNLFSDNSINGSGAIGTSGGAFYGHGITADVFSNNLIENTAGVGIGIEDFGQGYTVNQGNTIADNRLTNIDTAAASTDSGAIYLLGRSDNNLMTTITGNFISGVGAATAAVHAEGIYLDDNASGVTVTNNIVSAVQSDDLELHGGSDVSVTNNIFDLGTVTRTAVLFQQPPSDQPAAYTQPLTNDQVDRNIITSQQTAPQNVYAYFGSQPLPASIFGNLYWDPAYAGSALPTAASAMDSQPVVGSPVFVNATAGNYSLGNGSAASQIGFNAIDQTRIGLLTPPG